MEVVNFNIAERFGRIDKYLVGELDDLSRSQIQDMIADGQVTVNGKAVKASYKLEVGDEIEVTILPPKDMDVKPEKLDFGVVYEDSDVIVVNKPSGMIVHPTLSIVSGTLVNALLEHCDDLSGINGVMRPGIVHRIDKETSGLLMVAKNDLAHRSLTEQLKAHSVTRSYYALVHGNFPHTHGRIDAPIGRDTKDRQKMAVRSENSKEAVTNFTVVESFDDYTLVECRLETGRTHQIRVHMAYIDHPVLGDPKYGYRKDDVTYGQYLHAKTLGFVHPRTGEYLEFTSELPEFFETKIKELRGD